MQSGLVSGFFPQILKWFREIETNLLWFWDMEANKRVLSHFRNCTNRTPF